MRLWLVFNSLSTRARLMALLLGVIVPFSVLLIYSTLDRYRLLQENARDQMLHLARTAAAANVADRSDFKDAVASRQFVVGDLAHSRTTGLARRPKIPANPFRLRRARPLCPQPAPD